MELGVVFRTIGFSCYRANDRVTLGPFDRLRDLGASLRGGAAGIGREVESTGVFGWVTGDRLRRVKLFTTTGCRAVVKPCGLTTDCSGGVCRRSLGAVTRCSGR